VQLGDKSRTGRPVLLARDQDRLRLATMIDRLIGAAEVIVVGTVMAAIVIYCLPARMALAIVGTIFSALRPIT
jgi:hypothetical protein